MTASKFTSERAHAICALVRAGVSKKAAANQEGISEVCLHDWIKRGRLGERPYAVFAEEMEIAAGAAEATIVQKVFSAADGDWRAGAWWLERRNQAEYGAKQTVKVEKAPQEMSDPELDSELAAAGYVKREDAAN